MGVCVCVGGGGGAETIPNATLLRDSFIKMGSDESHFLFRSLCM